MWDLENNLICELLNIWNETSQIEWNGYRTFIWSTRTNLGLRYSLFAVWLRWSSLSECDLLGCMIVSSREVVLASFYLLSPLGLLSLAWDGVWLSANAISFFHRYVLLELWGKHELIPHSEGQRCSWTSIRVIVLCNSCRLTNAFQVELIVLPDHIW